MSETKNQMRRDKADV
ncbi:hypothetical protein BOH78_1019 [Pichia kudriavzevii]|uniref:Uncharacterized protein n=1 Tax=Pichia kudriavzevii TaxID=4909 RepID=A0A1V2LT92_PICKU|nr:hypothetical protein BOH78_1019 [Pichia kudriavzevii]